MSGSRTFDGALGAQGQFWPSSAGTGPRAIVVDDDAQSAALIVKLLAHTGCHATAFAQPEQAIRMALERQVDLLALDLSMPHIDGYQALALLRSHEHSRRLPSLPVVAITGRASPADRAATLAAGFAAHLSKPVELGDLHLALHVALSGRGELHRARYSVDEHTIVGRLREMMTHARGERMSFAGGFALMFEQRSRALIEQLLLDAYAGRAQALGESVLQLAGLARSINAAHLASLCDALGTMLPAGSRSIELTAAMLRAEVDRVVLTLREQVLC